MKRTISVLAFVVLLAPWNQAQTVTDIDGNEYNTVTIGNIMWMKENLKVIHFNNGDSIPNVTATTDWINVGASAYCNYNNDTALGNKYGKLYNWFAVTDYRKLCPAGWSSASIYDFENTLDLFSTDCPHLAANDFKAVDTIGWANNTYNTNTSGFSAFGAGTRTCQGVFANIKYWGYFWTTGEFSTTKGKYTCLTHNSNTFFFECPGYNSDYDYKGAGFSVRCKKNVTGIDEIGISENINVYPNPAKDRINIVNSGEKIISIQIFNLIGECLLQTEMSNGEKEEDISFLSKGIYLIKVTSDDGIFQSKLIKE